MIKLMKMVCLLIIILLLCFIIFNTRKAGFNQVSNTSNSKEHFYKDVICDLKNLTLNNESIITEDDANNINNKDSCTKLDLSKNTKLTTIGDRAFFENTNLTKIILPTSIETIGKYAFYDCDIKELDLSTNTKLTTIGDWAFNQNKKLTKISLPNSIETIGKGAFYNNNIQKLDLSNTKLTTISDQAFEDQAFEDQAFENNTNLTEISLPISIETIGEAGFAYCDIRKLDLSSNTKLTTIKDYAFESNKKLTKISLPISIETIGKGAFYNNNIQKLDLSTNTELTTIDVGAFYDNKNLTKIILPNSITTIGEAAFKGCPAIEKIIIKELVEGNQCPSNNDNVSNAGKLKNKILASLDDIVKNNIECKVLN